MTTTPVKDVKTLMNFVGSQSSSASAVRETATDSFSSLMSRASYNSAAASGQSRVESGKTSTVDSLVENRSAKTDVKKTDTLKTDAKKTDVKKTASEENRQTSRSGNGDEEAASAAERDQAVMEAGNEVIRETAETLDVSEEEVIDAMEELGFGLTDILDAGNLTQLVLTLSGEEDSLALLSDEELYGNVQDLLESLEGIREGLMETLAVDQEGLESVIAQTAERVSESGLAEISPEIVKEAAGNEQQPKFTVTVEEGEQSVKLAVDEKGNTIGVEEVAPKEEADNDSGKNRRKEEGGEEKSFAGSGSLVEGLFKEQPAQNVEASFEQMTAQQPADAQEIMDQILDYMKVQLKPEMDQLEMQLHPESLGTLRIQLMSKGGEITAQFHVQNEAVKAAIEGQLTVLKDTLKEQGVKVEAVEVTVESHEFESNLWQGKERDDNNPYQESRKAPRRINLDALDENFEEEADEEALLAAEMMRVNGGTVDFTA